MKRKSGVAESVVLPVLLVLGASACGTVEAEMINPGGSRVVSPGDTVTFWMVNGGNLAVNPGGGTLGITAQGASTVLLSGASVNSVQPAGATNASALDLVDSTATINTSTLTSANGIGLTVGRLSQISPGSTAQVTDSTITGVGRGINVAGSSTASLVNTQVTGTGTGGGGVLGDGVGATVLGGTLSVQGGSITGSNRGVVLAADRGTLTTPSVTLDNVVVNSTSGSAILVATPLGTVTNATVNVLNGTTLTAGNGVILEVGQAATTARASNVNFIADDSRLTGDVNAVAGSKADITLRNNAVVTGSMNNINSLDLEASTMTGDVTVLAGAPTSVVVANGSTYTGVMTNIASLNIDASAMTGSVVEASGSTAAVTLANNASLTGNLNNVASVSLDGSTMTGDVVQDAATPASIVLTNGSQLTGTVVQGQRMNVDGTSVFHMINDSSVGDLTLSGGTVDLRAGGAGFRTLNATTLAGTGTFALGTDLAGHLSDLVNVAGDANGTFDLRVQNTGVDPIHEDVPQKVVHTGGGTAAFAVLGGKVDVGTFVYRLEKRGTEWFLVQARSDEGTGPGPGTGDPGTPGDPGEGGEEEGGGGFPIISPSTATVVGIFSAAPTVWYGETATLRTRMGELRNGRDQGGAWARTYGNKYRVSATDQVDYTQTQSGISFGVDTPLPAADGTWLLGVVGGYSQSQLNLLEGSNGRIQSYYAGLYSTWLSTSGFYVDALLKVNRFQNKADVRMSDGEKSKGDYQNYGVGGSVEVGKHIAFADTWFVEPFVQASALWVQGDSYTLDNGLDARSNKADSFLAKAGTHVGKTIPLNGGGFAQPYVKVAAVHEFARANEVKVNRTTFSDDLSGSRAELGAGLAVQLNNVLQLHADVDYSNGERIEQPWGVNVGVRYSW